MRGKPDRNIHCIQFSLNLYKEISRIQDKLVNKKKGGGNDKDESGDEWLNIETVLSQAEIL